jgi:hypothetical protein
MNRPGMGLNFDVSKLGGNLWADRPEVIAAAKATAISKNAYRTALSLCLTMGSRFGYGSGFLGQLKKTAPFVSFESDADFNRGEMLQAFDVLSQSYSLELAEGADPVQLNNYILSGLCENWTVLFLQREGQHKRVLRDVFAFDGPNRIPDRNSSNLDFACDTVINRDRFWEVFECKQNPATFFEPFLWVNDSDPNRTRMWLGSQVRLALTILAVGTPKFASVKLICYWPRPQIESNLRRLDSIPQGIEVLDQQDAWEKLPWPSF